MKIIKEGIETIRPGRCLFFRELSLGTEAPTLNIVLVHGTCASSSQYDQLLRALDEEHHLAVHCYLYDAVGCGRSPVLPDFGAYHTNEQILDLKAILDTRIDSSRATLILGHSYAPTIILRYLCQKENPHIYACIFLSTAIQGGPLSLPNRGHPIFLLPVVFLKCLQPSLTNAFLKKAFDPSTDPALIETSRIASNNNDMYMCKGYHKHHHFASLREAAAIGNLPVLILHGASDAIISMEGGQHLADWIGVRATFKLIHNASHQVMQERPSEVAFEIKAFLKRLATD